MFQIIIEFPAVRRTQPSTKRPKFLQQPMSNCYNGYMVNNNNSPASLNFMGGICTAMVNAAFNVVWCAPGFGPVDGGGGLPSGAGHHTASQQ